MVYYNIIIIFYLFYNIYKYLFLQNHLFIFIKNKNKYKKKLDKI